MRDDRYFQFPLFLLRDLMTDKKSTLNDIISYGLYSYSETIQTNIVDVITQLMYCYYRQSNDMPIDLHRTMQRYIDNEMLCLDEEYYGFDSIHFHPEKEIEQLTEIFKDDSDFRNEAIEFVKIRKSYSYLGVVGNFENCLIVGKKIQSKIPKGEPMPMISKNQLFEFRDNDKTEFELMQFAINIGIRSIIGESSYSKTNKQLILCRAFGYNTIKHLPESMPEVYRKYSNRYHIDRVLQRLEVDNWNLIFYGRHIRGIYIGIKNRVSLESLIKIAEKKKDKTRIEELKATKNAIVKKVLNDIQKQKEHHHAQQ